MGLASARVTDTDNDRGSSFEANSLRTGHNKNGMERTRLPLVYKRASLPIVAAGSNEDLDCLRTLFTMLCGPRSHPDDKPDCYSS